MGAIVHNSAGIFIDKGWLRILAAGGHPRFRRSLPAWNDGRSQGFYLVADDVIGGFFALNGGLLGDDVGKIYYYAPDTLKWEACDLSYSAFFVWAMSEEMSTFYEACRWEKWPTESRDVTGDQALCVYPFLWADGPPIGERHRGTVPIAETWALQLEMQRQLGG